MFRYLELFVLCKIICKKKIWTVALFKKGVYSSVTLPDENTHTQNCICRIWRIWQLKKLLGKRGLSLCTTTNDRVFASYSSVEKSKLCEVQWTKDFSSAQVWERIFFIVSLWEVQTVYWDTNHSKCTHKEWEAYSPYRNVREKLNSSYVSFTLC